MTPNQSLWMTAREAAQYLRVSHRTILLWAKTKRIPAHKLSGAQRVTWRFLATELDAYLGGQWSTDNATC